MYFLPGKRAVMVVLAVLSMACWATVAGASLVIDPIFLGLPNSQLSGYTGPYAEIDITINSATSATITATALTNGGYQYFFIDGSVIDFNVNKTNVTSVTTQDSITSADGVQNSVDGWGAFNTTFKRNDGFAKRTTSLTFDLTGSNFSDVSQELALASLFSLAPFPLDNGQMVTPINFFAAHIAAWDGSGEANATGYATVIPGEPGGGGGNVPIPAAFWLIGAGLVRLGFYSRKRRQS